MSNNYYIFDVLVLIVGCALFISAMMNLEKLGRKPWWGILVMLTALGFMAYGFSR